MPKRNKPHARSRARAIKALEMRLAGRSNAEIAAALNYASESGARMAIDRELGRRTVEGVDTLRKEHGQRLLSLLSACWGKATAGNLEAIRTARPLLDSIAKLYGLDAAQRVAIEGISSEQFAREAVELIRVINGVEGPGSPAARVLADVPGVAAALPPGMRSELYGPPTPEPVEDDDAEPWSNIPGIDVEHVEPEAEAEPAVVVERSEPNPEPEVVEAEVVEDEPGRCGCGIEGEVVVLEPLPRSQFRVPAAAVWGRSVNPYDPLRGWRPR